METAKVTNEEQPSLAANPAFQAVMDGLPHKSNIVMYLNLKEKTPLAKQTASLQNPAQWLDAVALAIWATSQDKGNTTLLNGQLNLKLAQRKH